MVLKHVTVEQAYALKKLGFPQTNTVYGYLHPCDCYFTGRHSIRIIDPDEIECFEQENKFHSITDWIYKNISLHGMSVEAPTLELAAKWLREKKQWYIQIKWYRNQEDVRWRFSVESISDTRPSYSFSDPSLSFKTYEDALSEGLDKALELSSLEMKPAELIEKTLENMTDKEIAEAFKQIIEETGDCQSPTIEDYLEFLRTNKIEKQD